MSKPKRIIYPPIWLVFGLVAIFALDAYLPLARFTGTVSQGIGGVVIVAGLLLLIQAGGLFKQAETDLVPFKNVTALVTTGVFRFSRNPMYLGMALVLAGTAVTVGSASSLVVPPVFMVIIQLRFILPEEAMLRELFGDEFKQYCTQVRRWL